MTDEQYEKLRKEFIQKIIFYFLNASPEQQNILAEALLDYHEEYSIKCLDNIVKWPELT